MTRPALWCSLGALSLGISIGLAVWLQWALPEEDLSGAEYLLPSVFLLGALIAAGRRIPSAPAKAAGAIVRRRTLRTAEHENDAHRLG